MQARGRWSPRARGEDREKAASDGREHLRRAPAKAASPPQPQNCPEDEEERGGVSQSSQPLVHFRPGSRVGLCGMPVRSFDGCRSCQRRVLVQRPEGPVAEEHREHEKRRQLFLAAEVLHGEDPTVTYEAHRAEHCTLSFPGRSRTSRVTLRGTSLRARYPDSTPKIRAPNAHSGITTAIWHRLLLLARPPRAPAVRRAASRRYRRAGALRFEPRPKRIEQQPRGEQPEEGLYGGEVGQGPAGSQGGYDQLVADRAPYREDREKAAAEGILPCELSGRVRPGFATYIPVKRPIRAAPATQIG